MSQNRKPTALKNVGDKISVLRGAWNFGGDVPDNFDAHIRRSVPLYDFGHEMVCSLSDFFMQEESLGYELGVSTGELISKLSAHNAHKKNIKWVGLDSEAEMIAQAKAKCAEQSNIQLLQADAADFNFEKCDLVVSYYCIQFIPPMFRQALFDKIFASLNWGGGFILFEKVRAPDARFQDMMTALYDDFKSQQGFSEEEINSKKRSLRGVLEPYSTQANLDYLTRAGFKDVMSVMKCLSFEGFLAIK